MKEISSRSNRIVLLNLLSTIVLQGISFFSAPFFSSILGAANYGVVSVYNTWVQIFSVILPLQAAGAMAVARASFPLKDQERYQSSVFSLAIIAYALLGSVVYFLFRGDETILGLKQGTLIFALIQGLGMYCVQSMNGKNTYEFKAGRNVLLTGGITVLNIGLSLLLVHQIRSDVNYWGRIIGQCSAYVFLGALSYGLVLRSGKTVFSKQYWLFTLPITIPIIFHALAGLVLGQSDRLMLQKMTNDSSVGVYTLAATFCSVISSIWSALNNSWVPFFYEYTRLQELDKMKLRAKNYVELFSILCCGFILLSPEVFRLFASSEYWSGMPFIPLFVVGHYFVFLYSFSVNYEFYHKKTRLIAVATTIAAVTNIVLNYIFIHYFGVIGAVIATMMAHGVQFICHVLFAKRIKEAVYPFRLSEFIPGVLSLVIVTIVFFVFTDYLLVRWLLGAAMGVYLMIKMIKRRAIF